LAACGSEAAPKDRPGGATDLELLSSGAERTEGSPEATPAAATSLHALGASLYGELSRASGNLALSPYSVGVALALTLNGAKGETLEQMLGVLDAADVETLNGGLNALTAHIEGIAGSYEVGDEEVEIVLDAANTLFGEKSVTWAQDFLDTLAANYGAGLQTVDFLNDSAAATDAINAWVAEQTRDKIPVIIPEGLLDAATRLVLVNTLYLKAQWETPFEKSLTIDGPFTLEAGDTVQVPMMDSGSEGPGVVGRGDGWQATQLRYVGGELAMSIVLPDPGRLPDVEAALAAGGLPDILASFEPDQVKLTIPRWTFRSNSPLKEPLIALGMEVPFGDADFSGMTSEVSLFIAEVLHEVFIAVDEEGTEAAAVTAVVMSETSAPPPGTPFVVDRPFLFVIHDVEHGTPLFLGRVADPRAEA
jgi:serpin B